MSYIEENVLEIKEKIDKAAKKSGRRGENITLVAVTKTVDTERIREILGLGITNLGENRVQELIEKSEQLGNTPVWHMIGHLQTNKVRMIIDKVRLIHSVDSLKLAEEINKRAAQNNTIMDILLEINVAGENTKYGISIENIDQFIERIVAFSNICIKGLMCVAPNVENGDQNRIYFEKMMNLFVDFQRKAIHNMYMQWLSMGMTNDFEAAIEEGSNMVRIGTGLFGSRT